MKVTFKGLEKIKEYPKLSTMGAFELFEVMDDSRETHYSAKGWVGFRVYAGGKENVVWLQSCAGPTSEQGWAPFETVKNWRVRKLSKDEIVELRND